MVMPPESVLDALAVTLRSQVGPAVADPFAKTQAFMAAVILEKLAGQLRAAENEDRAAPADRQAMLADLAVLCGAPPPRLTRALDALTADGGDAAWCGLVEALYADRAALGPDFDLLLGRVRVAMRGRLNRALAFSS